MVETTDTIVAISTPPGRGGIGVVRVSGPEVKNIITGIVGKPLSERHAYYCRFKDGNREIMDDGIAVYFRAPASYTGEEMLEIYAHGNRVVLERIVNRIKEMGARIARPGEFTERAFHNNKLDLVQAEAVADLIDAVSDQAARSAVRSLEGEFSRQVRALLDKLVNIRVHIEGALDFPDEEIDFSGYKKISEMLDQCLSDLCRLSEKARQGAILKEGITVVITGRPNVGKSTLLNRLAGREAAIVTDEPGTTRDLIEQDILVDNIPVHIVDTAGIRKTGNKAEMEGINRAITAARNADILIVLVEHGQQPGQEEKEILDNAGNGTRTIIIHNKTDLTGVRPEIISKTRHTEILMSARTGEGVELLIHQLKEILGMQDVSEDAFMARKRHVDALVRTRKSIENAVRLSQGQGSTELLAEELRLAQHSLGEITGEFAPDDLLGEIFSNFCIGK